MLVIQTSFEMEDQDINREAERATQYARVESLQKEIFERKLEITNSFRAMDGKGGELVFATRPLKDPAEVKVIDQGSGIPQKHLIGFSILSSRPKSRGRE